MTYDAPPPDPYGTPPPGGPPPPGTYPPGYYVPPPQGYAYPAPQTSGKATAVLVLGILSLAVCMVLGIIALCLAPGAKQEIAESQGRLGGEGQIKAGVICAWISIAINLLILVGGIVVVLLLSLAASNS